MRSPAAPGPGRPRGVVRVGTRRPLVARGPRAAPLQPGKWGNAEAKVAG